MEKRLVGKCAIVTGGASGIGEAVAKTFLQNGCKVMIVDINGERLNTVYNELKQLGDCIAVEADVASEEAVIGFFRKEMDAWGQLDLLVNSAGRDSLSPPVSEVTFEEWKKILGTNLDGVFLCCREAFRIMEKQKTGGRIINMGSSSARLASSPGHSPYRASKHGMMGFSKNILLEGAKKNIGVTVLNPSHVKTPMTATLIRDCTKAICPPILTDGWMKKSGKKAFIMPASM